MSSPNWSQSRVASAVGATIAFTFVAGLAYLVALGHYLEDYCFTRTRSAAISPPGIEGPSSEGVGFAGPFTLRCEYDLGPAREAMDVWPALGLAALLLAVAGVCVMMLRWAMSSPPCVSSEPDQEPAVR